ncbi:hypothetical protein N7539_002922 [Penicillium diatomitis]|uniref:Zn(2)-C6 fungal-type domain-containing protein n=1 Tax=Penicillium diatomitis TaxID=2819901 RepID=A0A9W9XFK2_9EURO|nr:uncharacterized protein N7539_002922 [Penicillium diatomitis]KAJ5491355.1 hypothetical protein N7539_002922 [Penicillium diatomitis]
MVYCGKPSKGCGNCRSRKIRCDQARPACAQCIRAKKECPGYRDQLSLMFRDESRSVIRKATVEVGASPSIGPKAKGPTVRSPRTDCPGGKKGSTGPVGRAMRPRDPIHQSVDRRASAFCSLSPEVQPPAEASREEAICFFLRGNAIPGNVWAGEFVERFMDDPSPTPSKRAMQSSLLAVSSAMLSRARKKRSLQRLAQEEYVSALNLLNTALADVKEAKTNQALGAVILLAIYEIICSRAPKDIDQWTRHITGATALLHLRGPDQLKTEIGLRLFLHLRYQISNRLIMIIGRLASLRADLREGIVTDSHEVLAITSRLEADLVAWLATLPPEFNYQTETVIPYDILFQERRGGLVPYDDQYHEYPNLWISNTWNHYRCTRIIINEIALEHIRKLAMSSTNASLSEEIWQQGKAQRINIRRLAVDICRSVPYILGALPNSRSHAALPLERFMGGLTVLWPLFLAGIVERPNHALRRWVIQCLRLIGHSFGFDQALATMDIVAADAGILREVDDHDVAEECPSPVSMGTPPIMPDVHYTQIPASEETII